MNFIVEPSAVTIGNIFVRLENSEGEAVRGHYPPAEIGGLIEALVRVRDQVKEAEGFRAATKNGEDLEVSIYSDGDVAIDVDGDACFYLDPVADRHILDKLVRVMDTAAARKGAR